MAGRPRKPTKLLVLKGTATKARHGTTEQHFELPEGVPKPPVWIKGEALARWNQIIAEPAYRQILSALDDAAMVAHCVAWQTIADKQIAGEPVMAVDLAALKASIQSLGLSPADRARIKLPEKPKESKWAKFQAAPTG